MPAYYLEFADRDLAVMLMAVKGFGHEIWSGTPEQGERWLQTLRKTGVRPLVFRSSLHRVDGEEREYRQWQRVDAEGDGDPVSSTGAVLAALAAEGAG